MSNIPTHMRAVLLTGHGDVDRLELHDDVPVPTPGPCEVLVRVSAAAVNNTDINTREGWYSKTDGAEDAGWGGEPIKFPLIQGADACGQIVAVGDRVASSRLGERVLVEPVMREVRCESVDLPLYYGSDRDGGFAEYTVVAARHAHKVQSEMSDVELASFPCSYSTAENLLNRSGVISGQTVLVTGASGGVGSAAVQLAKARGATVLAVTSESKTELVKEIGADRILLRDKNLTESMGRNSVDVVVDLVAGPIFPSLLDVLKPQGTYSVSGAIGGPLVTLDVRTLYLKDLRFLGCTVIDEDVFPKLLRRIEGGDISPLVDRTYPLERIAEAQAYFREKRHLGKIVLTLN